MWVVSGWSQAGARAMHIEQAGQPRLYTVVYNRDLSLPHQLATSFLENTFGNETAGALALAADEQSRYCMEIVHLPRFEIDLHSQENVGTNETRTFPPGLKFIIWEAGPCAANLTISQ